MKIMFTNPQGIVDVEEALLTSQVHIILLCIILFVVAEVADHTAMDKSNLHD